MSCAPSLPEFLTQAEFARAIGSTENTVRGLIGRGELAATRLGGKVLVPRSELERLRAAAAANLRGDVVGPTMEFRGGIDMRVGGPGPRRPR